MEIRQKENKLRDWVEKFIKRGEFKGYYQKIAGSRYMRDVPDFLCCINGHFIYIELKTVWGKLTKKQHIKIREIENKGGGIGITAYGQEDFVQKFEYIYKRCTNDTSKKSKTESSRKEK